MATGIRAEVLTDFVEMFRRSGLELPTWFYECLLEHYQILSSPGFIRLEHNHGVSAALGLGRLASVLPSQELREAALSQSLESLDILFRNQFDGNFVHKEHSPHYHFHTVREFTRALEKLNVNASSPLRESLKKAVDVGVNLYLPDGREIPFGDTDNASGSYSSDDLIQDTRLWLDSGYAVFRDHQTYLAATNQFHSNVHKHWDNLSFIFGFNGQDILIDPGEYAYRKDAVRDSVLSSSSHNTVSVRGGWSGKNLIKESLGLSGSYSEEGLLLDGAMQLNLGYGKVSVARKIRFSGNKLEIGDEVNSASDPGAFASFVFHETARIQQANATSFSVFYPELEARILFESPQGVSPQVTSKIKEVKISRSYGTWVNAPAIQCHFTQSLTTSLEIIEL
jgi:hypothetical protein